MTRIEITRELLRRAILTLAAIPDPDRRFRTGPKTAWPAFAQDWHAYAARDATVREYTPTPDDIGRYLTVLDWLTAYGRQSARNAENARLFVARTFGVPIIRLQIRVTTNRPRLASAKTVHNRLDHVVETIAKQHETAIEEMRLDKFPEFPKKGPHHGDGGKSAHNDLTDPPASPKFIRNAGAEPAAFLTFEEAEAIRREAEKQDALRKRKSANRRRKRANRNKSRGAG